MVERAGPERPAAHHERSPHREPINRMESFNAASRDAPRVAPAHRRERQ